jgi:hypothetical protein
MSVTKFVSAVPFVFIRFKPKVPPTRSRPDESKDTSLDPRARSAVMTVLKPEEIPAEEPKVPNVVFSAPVLENTRTRPMPVGPPNASSPELLKAKLVAFVDIAVVTAL